MKNFFKINNFYFREKKSSKAFKLTLFTTLLFLATLLLAPFFFNNENLRQEISQKIGKNFIIKGEVKTALLPTPSITFKDAVLTNHQFGAKKYNIYIEKTRLKISLFSFFSKNFSLKEVKFSNLIIEKVGKKEPIFKDFAKATSQLQEKDQSGFDKNLFSLKKLDLAKIQINNLPKIIIENSKFIFDGKKIDSINSVINFSDEKIVASGNFLNENTLNNFTFDLRPKSQKQNSTITLDSNHANLKIIGGFIDENRKNDFSKYFTGNLSAKIHNLKGFYKSFIANKGLILQKLNPESNEIKIAAKITRNDLEFSLINIKINSGLANAKGNINLEFSHKTPIIDVNLDMKNANLNAIWLKNKKISKNIGQQSLSIADNLKNIDLTLELKIEKMRYLNDNIKNIDAYATLSSQGEILLMPLSLEIPGQAKTRINGVIKNHKFIGKIDAKGQDLGATINWLELKSQNLKHDKLKEYSFYCDVMLTPQDMSLSNIYLNIANQNTEILGETKIDHHNKISNIISNFEIHNLNINDYFLISRQNIYLSPGNLLKKILWLNNLNSRNDATLTFDKLRYNNFAFKQQTLKTTFGPGYLEVEKFKLENENLDLETSFAIDITGENPKIDAVFKANNFIYISPEPTILEKQNNVTNRQNALDQFFALPSFENFRGSLFAKFKNAKFDNLKLKNIDLQAKLRDGILDFSKFSGNIYDGSFNFTGSTSLKFNKSISGNLNIKNAKIKPLLENLIDIKNINGALNISSAISSTGDKKSDFIKNLNLSSKFSASTIFIEKWGLNSLIKKMFNPYYFKEELQNPLKILYNKNDQTRLDKASGDISINKGRKNKFKIKFFATALSGVSSGEIDLLNKNINAKSNIIFLTGNKKKQIPINIANNFSKKFDKIEKNDNITQAQKYLDSALKQINQGLKEVQFKEKNESKSK